MILGVFQRARRNAAMNEVDETLARTMDTHQLEVRAISQSASTISARSLYGCAADHLPGSAKRARTQGGEARGGRPVALPAEYLLRLGTVIRSARANVGGGRNRPFDFCCGL